MGMSLHFIDVTPKAPLFSVNVNSDTVKILKECVIRRQIFSTNTKLTLDLRSVEASAHPSTALTEEVAHGDHQDDVVDRLQSTWDALSVVLEKTCCQLRAVWAKIGTSKRSQTEQKRKKKEEKQAAADYSTSYTAYASSLGNRKATKVAGDSKPAEPKNGLVR